jgi:hypothetical protein
MKSIALLSLGLLAACGGANETIGAGQEDDASSDASRPLDAGPTDSSVVDAVIADAGLADAEAGDGAPDPCADASVPPYTLACTGLYSDFASQTLSPSAVAYAPAVPLWSDGATKERWIELPPGQQIDVSNPSEWVFPVGTKLFKQFTYEGVRVETRMFQKVEANYWVYATYAWSSDLTAATISYGATVPVGDDGGTWIIPTNDQCNYCHSGRLDRILGFEQVSLGLEGATGLTLLQLVVQNLITPAPTQVNLRIGDDGTGLNGPALSWLHINCGVTCHNANPSAQAYAAGMLLRLDPTQLDGTPANSSTWNDLATTIGVPCVSAGLQGNIRIQPGDPSASEIVELISERGTLQMPPIASRFVDTTDVASVVDWIQHMPVADAGEVDAGPEEASALDASVPDATVEAGIADGGTEAAASPDSGATDATVPEAGSDGAVSLEASGPDATQAEGGTGGSSSDDGSEVEDGGSD